MYWGQHRDASGIASDSTLTLTHLEQGIYWAQIEFLVTSAGSGTQLRADATVLWYPPRTTAEYISSARFHAVTVTATVLKPRLHTITRTLTSAAPIAQLANLLNQAHAMPAGMTFECPAEQPSYELAFETAPGAHPSLLALDSGCGNIGITVNGKVQPPLMPDFASTAAKLLGLRSVAG